MTDDELIDLAIAEARRAPEHGDVPIGAVVVRGDDVLASRHNEREQVGDPTAHAEILALRDAAATLDTWRLDGCTIGVTLEPCAMCAGALVNARIDRLVFGAYDMKAGAASSLYNLCADPRLNHEVEIAGGIRTDPCTRLLTAFFGELRSPAD